VEGIIGDEGKLKNRIQQMILLIFGILILNSFFCLGVYFMFRPIGRDQLHVEYINRKGENTVDEAEGTIDIKDIPVGKKPLDWIWKFFNNTYKVPNAEKDAENKRKMLQWEMVDLEKEYQRAEEVNDVKLIKKIADAMDECSKLEMEAMEDIAYLKQRRWRFHRYIRDALTDCPQCFATIYGTLMLIFVDPYILSMYGIEFSLMDNWLVLLVFIPIQSFMNMTVHVVYKILVGVAVLMKQKC